MDTPVFPDLSVLVVDDNSYLRRVVRDMLTRVGFRLELSEVREEQEDPGEVARFHHVVARVAA